MRAASWRERERGSEREHDEERVISTVNEGEFKEMREGKQEEPSQGKYKEARAGEWKQRLSRTI